MRSGRRSEGAHRKARGKLVRLAATEKKHASGATHGAREAHDENRSLKHERGRRREEEAQGDETSRKLQEKGVYHIRDRNRYAENDAEGPKFSSPVTYSFWSGAKYCLMLSLLLWWFPLVGNMIAGYIGGRRAGGPWRGVLATRCPSALYLTRTRVIRSQTSGS